MHESIQVRAQVNVRDPQLALVLGEFDEHRAFGPVRVFDFPAGKRRIGVDGQIETVTVTNVAARPRSDRAVDCAVIGMADPVGSDDAGGELGLGSGTRHVKDVAAVLEIRLPSRGCSAALAQVADQLAHVLTASRDIA